MISAAVFPVSDSGLFDLLHRFLKQAADREMLRALCFTGSALQTVGSLSVSASGDDVIVIIGSIPVVESFMGVLAENRSGIRMPWGHSLSSMQ